MASTMRISSSSNSYRSITLGTNSSDEPNNGSCSLNATDNGDPGLTGTNFVNYTTCFVNNSVYGGCFGQLGSSAHPYAFSFSGNLFSLFPPSDNPSIFPGAAILTEGCQNANVFGNTLSSGG